MVQTTDAPGHREPSSSRMSLGGIGYSSHQNAGYNKLFTQVY